MKSKHTLHFPKQLFAFVFFSFLGSTILLAQTKVVDIFQGGFSSTRTTAGTATYTVPVGGPYTYKITAIGGEGGSGRRGAASGGKGAIVTGWFDLPSGTQLVAIAGSHGYSHSGADEAGSGGGSSGVFWVGVGHLLVAGAGGGGGYSDYFGLHGGVDAVNGFVSASDPGLGGLLDGGGVSVSSHGGGGGGGGNGDGMSNSNAGGGKSYGNGGDGGRAGTLGANNYWWGGGGYTGGGAAYKFGCGGGGAGFSNGHGGRLEAGITYGGDAGTSFMSTLGYTTSFSLTNRNYNGGSVKIELYARYSDFGTLIPSGISDDLVFEFNQLEALYRATVGANWANKTNWLTGGDMSQWHGVTLTADGKSVSKIILPSNNLRGGNIPDLNLSELQILNLGNNAITGAIPNFNYLPNLQILQLNTNQFSGSIPNFASCGQLSELNLAINNLTGSLPYFPLTWMTHIDVGLNQLTGTFPPFFSYNHLTFLSVYGNQMSGTIPTMYLPALQTLYLSNNNFSGDLPNIVGTMGFIAPNNVYLENNRFDFGNLLGKLLVQGTGTVVYAPQQKVTLTLSGGQLSMNTGIASGDPSVNYYWYRDGVLMQTSTANFYTPIISGNYTCEVSHNSLTVSGNAPKNLILISNPYAFVGVSRSNGNRVFPAGMNDCLVPAFNELEKIYDAAGGENWTNKTNWLTNKDLSTWFGVTMTGCNVATIALNGNNLVGTIPNLTLPNLTSLNLSSNTLSGTIPNFSLPNLTTLNLAINQLSGAMPTLSGCTSLSYLNVAINSLTGAMPNFNGTSLTHIDLGINQLSGTLPALSLPNLTYLSVYQNQMTGAIPDMNLPVLTTAYFSFNQFTGGLSDFGSSPNLNLIHVDNNKFNFASVNQRLWRLFANAKYAPQKAIPITFTFGNLTVSSGLSDYQHTYEWYKDGVLVATTTGSFGETYTPSVGGVYSCKIYHQVFTVTGDPLKNLVLQSENIDLNRTSNGGRAIPVALPACLVDDFNELEKIYDATGGANWTRKDNWFTSSSMSTWYGVFLTQDQCNVAVIRLGANNLVGTMPNLNLPNLTELVLSSNQLAGALPNFSTCPQLSYLNVAINNLTAVPASLPNSLTYFDIGINQITGTFPNWTMPNLAFLSFYGNQLSGAMPTTVSFPALQTLHLTYNQLTALPPLTSFHALTNLYIANNQFSGAIPNFANLTLFHLDNNRFVFGDMTGKTWLNAADVKYIDQTVTIPISYNACVLTASLPSADGTENYDWYKDGVFVVRTSTPNYTPSVSGTYLCKIQHPVITVSNNTNRNLILQSSSQAVTIAVPSVSITASPSTTISWTTTVTFTATPTNGGTTPQYQWFLNNNPVGTNSTTYSNSRLQNGDVVKCTLTPTNGCQTGVTVNSNNLTITVTCPSSIIYVKPTASGDQTGSSWANATSDLQTAINNSCGNTEIWVAKGTYKPTTDANGSTTPTDNRDKAFYLKNGSKIYGGFAGTEGGLSERNLTNNATILSGDLNGDDSGFSNNSENSYHVVISGNDDNTTVLDGFVITGGNANSATNYSIEGYDISRANGGGLQIFRGSPTVSNVIFTGNYGGVGGGVFNVYSNSAFSNLIVSGNTASYAGGIFNQYSSPTITNATIHNNVASLAGGGIYNQYQSSPTITNCIVWGNTNNGTANNIFTEPAQSNNLTVSYSIVEDGHAGSNNSSSNPNFVNSNAPKGTDNQWFTADDGLQLACNSPARDAGTTGSATDIFGNTTYNSVKDMGAYERQDNAGCPIYAASTSCETTTLTSVSGNRNFNIYVNNQIVAVLNPNGQNLGTVTVQVGKPRATNTEGGQKTMGRGISITSSIAPTGNYSLCLFYKNTELTELSTAHGTTLNRSQLAMAWKSGGAATCDWTAATPTTSGAVSGLTNVDYGVGNDGFYLQFNLNHFTLFAPTPSGVLPVELLKFSGNTEGGKNYLFWQTAEEKNVAHFDIERSLDGVSFIKIGQTKARGSNSVYAFVDDKPKFGLNYYRLKINDLDGKVSFSKIISLESKNTEGGKIKVFPNPVDTYLNIELVEPMDEILVINSIGQIVLKQKTLGQNQLALDVNNLSNGVYFIKTGSNTEGVKFVKN